MLPATAYLSRTLQTDDMIAFIPCVTVETGGGGVTIS